MSKIDIPPLVEAIFELRWGETSPNNFYYDDNDKTTFLMKFSAQASAKGYADIEPVNLGAPDQIPMFIKHRFWKARNTWPCMQVGMGILTVNHTTHGYSWDKFLKAVNEGVSIFDSSDNQKLQRVNNSGKLRLIYQDIFSIEDISQLQNILKDKLSLEVSIPSELLDNKNIKKINTLGLSFGVETIEPLGSMLFKISQVMTTESNKPSFLVETIIESKMKDIQAKTIQDVEDWAIKAHNLQKHSYNKLMKGN